MQAYLQEVHPRLFSDEDDRRLCTQIIHDIKALTAVTEAGSAILPHLEMLVVDRTCNDPGRRVVNELLLPLIRERLERLAEEDAARKVQEAQEEMDLAEV